ncbi:ABC-three component system protein [Desemzia incerta]|uniref:ABC-three component system protein n=1 Tax=Desemzia incerta TaxID=82801 RepID=UPI001660565C|nr:ABC-three component system protein [Desemzia incerta]
MSRAESYITKILFQNRIYKYDGQQFEDFFVAIMSKCNNNFQAVKPYGNIGDRKNDGFDKTAGVYFQVFSPEDITKTKTINDAINKLEDDFTKLYAYWNKICPIEQYYFVINDKYKGISSPIIEKCIEIGKRKEYKHLSLNIFSSKDLEKQFDSLDVLQIQDIIGYIPDEELEIIKYDALNETVQFLINIEVDNGAIDVLSVPNFDDKIMFNGLSDQVKIYLTNGSYQEGTLNQYFNANPGLDKILQEKFHSLYLISKEEISDDLENASDARFFSILEESCYKPTVPIQSCVFVLMAHYFASCDIFEEPIEERNDSA